MRFLLPLCLGAACAYVVLRASDPEELVPVPVLAAESEEPRIQAEVIEVRDASLFAGACHLASEADSQGRDALIAVLLEEGTFGGVDLGGVRALVAVSAEGNLGTDASRRSEVWVDGSQEQSLAMAKWLARERASAVGEVLAAHRASVEIDRCGSTFSVKVPGVAWVRGEAITDGSCCSMPERRLYDPLLTESDETVVGFATTCRFEGTESLTRWRYSDANNVHLGRIEPSAVATPCPPVPCELSDPCGQRQAVSAPKPCQSSIPKP